MTLLVLNNIIGLLTLFESCVPNGIDISKQLLPSTYNIVSIQ